MALEYMETSLFNHKQLCGGLSNIKGCTMTSRMPAKAWITYVFYYLFCRILLLCEQS